MKKFFQNIIAYIKRYPLKAICSALMVVFAVVFACCSIFLINYYKDSRTQAKQNEQLVNMLEQAKQEVLQEGGVLVVNPDGSINEELVENPLLNGSNIYVDVTSENGEQKSILKEYAPIYKLNNDMVGWIQIPGTNVNYPVLQNMDNENYYLKRDFYKQDARHGSIYAYEWANFHASSQNITLFGHNMGDDSMFAGLHAYEDEAFYKDHPYIIFDTLTSHQVYKVISVFYITLKTDTYDYHEFTDTDDPHAFGQFMDLCNQNAMYDTGDTAIIGSELLTLSTCDNDVSDDSVRFVVVAMKVSL